MVGVAQDVQGNARVKPIVAAAQVRFPVLIDRSSAIAAFFGFQITPSGVFLDREGFVRYVHGSVEQQFDVADPRVRLNLDLHLAGEAPRPVDSNPPVHSDALSIFSEGARHFDGGDTEGAIKIWRRALEVDPDNFLIRSQIWAAEHPERFWPTVDRNWQKSQLVREGYDKPLP